MIDILGVILPTFIAIFIGIVFGKTKKKDMSGVIDVAIYVCLPALAFASIFEKEIVLTEAVKVWASALLITFGCGMIARIIFHIQKQKHSGLYLPISFMNTLNIPFPIIYLAFGSAGLLPATLFYIASEFLLYSFGVHIASKRRWKEGIKEIFKVPPLTAAILGFLLNIFGVTVPDLVMQSLRFIGTAGVPLVLIALGHILSKVKIRSYPTTLLASFLRLGFGLSLGILAVNVFDLSGILRATIIFDSAMPSAVVTSILATKYNNEAELVSSVVFTTTIISLFTIPLLLMVLS